MINKSILFPSYLNSDDVLWLKHFPLDDFHSEEVFFDDKLNYVILLKTLQFVQAGAKLGLSPGLDS